MRNISKYRFSSIIDLSNRVSNDEIHSQLKNYGYLLVKDKRIDWKANEEYFDLMEQYFQKRALQLEQSGKVDDCFPQYKYQIGLGYENIGKPNYDKESLKSMIDQPILIDRDPKWKYFWPYRYDGQYNPPQWVPKDFPNFERIMNKWQISLLRTTELVLEILSLAFNEKQDFFYNNMNKATHLLSPIGCDLQKHQINTRFSGYHYDLNFITVHTKSRFPGLFVWLPNGKRVELRIPEQTVLLQPGKLFELMTGGVYKAGYHEAFLTEEAKRESIKQNKRWRVTSTLFTMLNDDTILQTMPYFKDLSNCNQAPISVKEQFQKELNKLSYV
ncbi:unnamed protein product [Paramecium pentaurelia]|uniref:Isopenicillin N synthase-like Fe(2+) 2OG dioxygenase domain-containing protein n=1 Tax=Paramecium pentaurelia TaxID=43138 RepID=A0A8S1Y353_9CILI|nr:unnamed protein product [Paramecium pentaurelia]